jgi:PhnB protein
MVYFIGRLGDADRASNSTRGANSGITLGIQRPFIVARSEAMQVQPYVFFNGRAAEAAEFYRKAVGAEVQMMVRFRDNPDPQMKANIAPGTEDKVMHMQLRIGETAILCSDGRCTGKTQFEGFALSLTVPDEAAADKMFQGLVDGGQVQMPLTKTFFSPRFGMLSDRFGLTWMVYVKPQQ